MLTEATGLAPLGGQRAGGQEEPEARPRSAPLAPSIGGPHQGLGDPGVDLQPEKVGAGALRQKKRGLVEGRSQGQTREGSAGPS